MICRISPRRFQSIVTNQDVRVFEYILGAQGIRQTELDKFNIDWTGQFKGSSTLVLQPRSTEEVSEVMKYAFSKQLQVCPQGGNTGLVGGSIPLGKEIILCTSRMNKILSIDVDANVLTLEAGVVLQDAETYCNQHNLTMPIDLGSKGSCQLGGNLATNAGGIRFLRFGSLRSNCLGLTVVLSNGEVLNSLRKLRKDNVGYDLKQNFLGSEGTLGIITEASIMVHAKPFSSTVALFGVDKFESAILLLRAAKARLGPQLSACEYFDHACLFQSSPPFSSKFYVLIEGISPSQEDEERLMDKFDSLYRSLPMGICQDSAISQNEKQYQEMWAMRETISGRLKQTRDTWVFKFDVSLPNSQFDLVTQQVRERIQRTYPQVQVFQYGHLGDGNLHFNATIAGATPALVGEIQHEMETELYGLVQVHQGSISAEHGLGQLKASKILKSRTLEEVEWMRRLKQMWDPLGLLNPGKVLVTAR